MKKNRKCELVERLKIAMYGARSGFEYPVVKEQTDDPVIVDAKFVHREPVLSSAYD